ncbi:MAG: hypothetical protein JSR37_08995 [Verrucomicrobia bacterium]|nr:hypothetical protein [Verrucomicrobiota bacterium]MBS0636240.1 hypothetical protein [Verrucomicrobiota bacterium]
MKANLSSSQIFCSHCEELVHEYAVKCPYCNKDIDRSSPVDKIAQIHVPASPIAAPEQVLCAEQAPSALPEAFTVLLSLASLLAASFFFFFGVIIKLFGTNGTFVLEWNVGCWPYFVGSSLILLCLGLYSLSNLDE